MINASELREPSIDAPPPSAALAAAAVALREAVFDPFESIQQSFQHDATAFGDPRTPATPAFHLRHTVEVFRLHARKVIAAVEPTAIDRVASDDAPIPLEGPFEPTAVKAELERAVDAFAAWLERQPTAAEAVRIEHGRDFALLEFLRMMTRHIVWHAAAIHYRAAPPRTARRW